MGDSGGPLMCPNKDGKMELHGNEYLRNFTVTSW